jgi:hypothetical protein
MAEHDKRVLVTGDVVIDHNIYRGNRDRPASLETLGTHRQTSRGGAKLVFDLLDHVGRLAAKTSGVGSNKPPLFSVTLGLEKKSFGKLPTDRQGYGIWRAFPKSKGAKEKVWRMSDSLGYGSLCEKNYVPVPDVEALAQAANVLVLDDGGLGFRVCTSQDAWPKPLRESTASPPARVVLKMAAPVAQGDLWRTLSSGDWARRTVALFSIEDLRREEVRISSGISWERTALDLVQELEQNPILRPVACCGYHVVSFGVEGAMLVESDGKRSLDYTLIFDPARLEGDWSREIEGEVFGYMSCLTAAVARHLLVEDTKDGLVNGIKAGLSAMRTLLVEGHGPVYSSDPRLPLTAIAAEILKPSTQFAVARVPDAHANVDRSKWTIITDASGAPMDAPAPLYGMARRAALLGPKALQGIPYQKFGKLFTVDRSEIEALRNLQELVQRYEETDDGEKPLNIAVFGAPGAGKSFSVKQIARAALGDKVPILEFNLSQFNGIDDLVAALHVARDKRLEGRTPVVFWDEFDTHNYKWLQYLLAPMQDGAFREGQIVHPIGKCVFVFAGGTSYDFENFGPQPEEPEYADFKMKKGPDFISRLSGYLNVLGPNPRQQLDRDSRKWIHDPTDICFPVRRALLLRVMAECYGNAPLSIDSGVLTALLEVRRYNHGARSMQKIVSTLRERGVRGIIRRSDLPPSELMAMHADCDEFVEIANRDLEFQVDVEPMARELHERFREARKGTKYDVDFDVLPLDVKQDNRAAVARIPQVLGLAGLYVVHQDIDVGDSKREINEIIENNVELLAESEHSAWVEFKLTNGWRYGKPRCDKERIHDCLVPYCELPEDVKNLDRQTVQNYWDILEEGGYKIVTRLPFEPHNP